MTQQFRVCHPNRQTPNTPVSTIYFSCHLLSNISHLLQMSVTNRTDRQRFWLQKCLFNCRRAPNRLHAWLVCHVFPLYDFIVFGRNLFQRSSARSHGSSVCCCPKAERAGTTALITKTCPWSPSQPGRMWEPEACFRWTFFPVGGSFCQGTSA